MNKIIPPYLFIFSLAVMLLINFISFLETGTKSFLLFSLGAIVNLCAIIILLRANYLIKKYNTEIHTFKTPQYLIRSDIFKFTRNPIYLAFVLLLAGTALLLQSFLSLIISLLYFLCCNYWYIPFEEKKLERCFGEKYARYRKKVRRWL